MSERASPALKKSKDTDLKGPAVLFCNTKSEIMESAHGPGSLGLALPWKTRDKDMAQGAFGPLTGSVP
ncbi:hypothetical protein VTL71DRAFT_605 [Oculimacula yallundae]|uniref:Uncharacterized protein n=1 Tax=Oculimacula yallundae TaxID=86028 RepID=A0ABR4D1G6_9HELO